MVELYGYCATVAGTSTSEPQGVLTDISTPAVDLASYDFISDPLKKAFFETAVPASASGSGEQHHQAMLDKSDVDINLEAKINQYAILYK